MDLKSQSISQLGTNISFFRYLNLSGLDQCSADQFSNKSIYSCDNGWVADESIIHSSASIDLEMVCSNQWKKSFAQRLLEHHKVELKSVCV